MMKIRPAFKYALNVVALVFASNAWSVDISVVNSKKRVFFLNESKFESTLEQLNTDKPIEVTSASQNADASVNTLMSVLAAMKQGDIATSKSLNFPEKIERIEQSLKIVNLSFENLAKNWSNEHSGGWLSGFLRSLAN
jgi:ABC-type glutathione transport system ATPase component